MQGIVLSTAIREPVVECPCDSPILQKSTLVPSLHTWQFSNITCALENSEIPQKQVSETIPSFQNPVSV